MDQGDFSSRFGAAVAAAKAEWLAEVAEALNQATKAVMVMSVGDRRMELFQLYAEIEALKLDVDLMRRSPRYSQDASKWSISDAFTPEIGTKLASGSNAGWNIAPAGKQL